MRFVHLKVRTRIYLGFAALAVLSLGIALFGAFQFSGVGTNAAGWTPWQATVSACCG